MNLGEEPRLSSALWESMKAIDVRKAPIVRKYEAGKDLTNHLDPKSQDSFHPERGTLAGGSLGASAFQRGDIYRPAYFRDFGLEKDDYVHIGPKS